MKDSTHKILISCVHAALPSASAPTIRQFATCTTDWDYVNALAARHGILPLLYQNLKRTCSDILPADVITRMKRFFIENATKNLSYASTLLKILKTFAENEVVAIPFKGPLLAEYVYGDISLRQFGDLDILVKRDDAIRAKNILLKNGYNLKIALNEPSEKKYLQFENFFSLSHPKGGPTIDLHWEITGRYLLQPVYLEAIEKNLQSIIFLGQKVTTLSDAFTLVYLCVHGTSHCWDRLEWLISFSEMMHRKKHELPRAIELAEKMGCKRMLQLGLLLSHDLLGSEIPKKLRSDISLDSGILNACKKIKQTIYNPRGTSDGNAEWRFSPLHIQIRDTFADRIKYAVYLYTAPTIKEWHKWPDLNRLPICYRALRPIRLGIDFLFWKRIKGTFSARLINRMEDLFEKEREKGSGVLHTLIFRSPLNFAKKNCKDFSTLINKIFFHKDNNRKLRQFNSKYQTEAENTYYVIAVPGKLDFLIPCLELIEHKVKLSIILNGLGNREKQRLQNRFPAIPAFELKTFLNSTMGHGEVINLLLETNKRNFGLIDHDLYIFNDEIFDKLSLSPSEIVSGPFGLRNRKAGIVFPATHLIFINTHLTKKIMAKYQIGAQIYYRIPKRLKPILNAINLGYHNFLKDYLNFFDPLNMIWALSSYEGYETKIVDMDPCDFYHFGCPATDEVKNNPQKTKELLSSICEINRSCKAKKCSENTVQ